ncbi:DEAD/DEAH box helicase [Jatrophihabitans endophyticus]|uniref:DEAD/DEAH box helicase n=1 Tax=Jatrophihabitans endophyticus TaxID=1206085 RepID=UPI0026E9555B|nr:DEAD/DEAH box helicase [Jatrophihabitans endophyticus]
MTTFAELELRPELQRVLDGLGYEEPTPIQSETIPPLLAGHDVVGQAATGTGKTAAFALPLLQRLHTGAPSRGATPQALVLVPTRELAIQVAEAVHRYGRELGARVLAVYGGAPIARQITALRNGVDVVVATPGRAIDHISRGTVDFTGLTTIVLDEADEMLDMGFAEDIEAIMDAVPAERQTVLFSATLPKRIDGLVRQYLRDPVRIRIQREPSSADNARVRQVAYLVPRQHKANALGRLLDIESPTATVIFCRTRDEVDTLGETLAARGYRAEALHGGMTQDQRDRVMAKIRNQTSEVLVATDVAARGLDIDHLTHVVNYDLPSAADAYVHRIGRVGRAGREGTAITLVEPRQHRLLKTIEKVTKSKIAVETLPTVADLRARRLELTRAALAQTLQDGEFEQYRVVVDTLTDDYDLVEIAMAAVQLAHESSGGAPDEDIPDPRPFERYSEAPRDPAPRSDGASRPAKGPRANSGPTTRIFVSLGHAAKIRPQDLVGAIAGETSLSGRQIGAIEITHKFSTVEVPTSAADEVIAALQATMIKGRKARVERYKPPAERPKRVKS